MTEKFLPLTQLVIGVIILLVALVIIDVFNISYPISVTTTTRSSELSVVGEGKVDVSPDVAFVDVGVTVDKPSVEEAEAELNQKNNAVVESMEQLNIPAENIKTTDYSIYPKYDYSSGPERITGYTGSVTLSIKLSEINGTGEVIRIATTAGANRVQGVRFAVDKPEVFREEARQMAIDNAKEQAEKIADSLGIKLGKVVNIVESTPSGINPIDYRMSSMDIGAKEGFGGAAEMQPGSQTITSVVTLYFEKK